MAGLFPNNNSQYTFGNKSHTNLVISEGAAPAQKFAVSKTNEAEHFLYEYGPEGQQTVVLAKGKAVEAGPAEYDSETGRMLPTIKQATEGTNKFIGTNLQNSYKKRRDGMNRGESTIITRSYIEVPLFEHESEATAQGFAKAMRYGAAYGGVKGGADGTTNTKLEPGDFVKVGKDGNYVKLDTAKDSPFQIVGQVWEATRELPPAGFLQYYMELANPELEEMLKAMSHAPSAGKNGKDAGAYPYGYPYQNKGWKPKFEENLIGKAWAKGIPFLTDGFFRAQERRSFKIDNKCDIKANSGNVEAVRANDKVEIAGAQVTVPKGVRNGAVYVKLHHPINKTKAVPAVVKYTNKDGAVVSVHGEDVHIDFENNMVIFYIEEDQVLKDVTIEAELVVDPVAGIPTEWDYAGSVGAVRILLQR